MGVQGLTRLLRLAGLFPNCFDDDDDDDDDIDDIDNIKENGNGDEHYRNDEKCNDEQMRGRAYGADGCTTGRHVAKGNVSKNAVKSRNGDKVGRHTKVVHGGGDDSAPLVESVMALDGENESPQLRLWAPTPPPLPPPSSSNHCRFGRRPRNLTLAVDGNGLAFHLLRRAHVRHCRRVALADASACSSSSSSLSSSFSSYSAKDRVRASAVIACLPSLMPLDALDKEVDDFFESLFSSLSSSSLSSSSHVYYYRPPSASFWDNSNADALDTAVVSRIRIYYDGPNQRGKGLERHRRNVELREAEWDRLMSFCLTGALPQKVSRAVAAAAAAAANGCAFGGTQGSSARKTKGRGKKGMMMNEEKTLRLDEGNGGTARRRRHRHRRRRQQRQQQQQQQQQQGTHQHRANASSYTNSSTILIENVSDAYLSSFPLSPLSLLQIRCSIERWARRRRHVHVPPLGASSPSPSPMPMPMPMPTMEVIQCDGEADPVLALASANDAGGNTVVVASDSDFCIYGYDSEAADVTSVSARMETVSTSNSKSEQKAWVSAKEAMGKIHAGGTVEEVTERLGDCSFNRGRARRPVEVSYLTFDALEHAFGRRRASKDDPDDDNTNDDDNDQNEKRNATTPLFPAADAAAADADADADAATSKAARIHRPSRNRCRALLPLRRSDVASALGLPDADALVEASIVLGNDYTRPYLWHNNAAIRGAYRSSIRWAPSLFPASSSTLSSSTSTSLSPPPPPPPPRGGGGCWDGHAGGGDGNGHADPVDWSDPRSVLSRVSLGGKGARIESSLSDLQTAIEFTRAMYGLCDVSDFCDADLAITLGGGGGNKFVVGDGNGEKGQNSGHGPDDVKQTLAMAMAKATATAVIRATPKMPPGLDLRSLSLCPLPSPPSSSPRLDSTLETTAAAAAAGVGDRRDCSREGRGTKDGDGGGGGGEQSPRRLLDAALSPLEEYLTSEGGRRRRGGGGEGNEDDQGMVASPPLPPSPPSPSGGTMIQRAHLDAARSVLDDGMTTDCRSSIRRLYRCNSRVRCLRLPATRLSWDDICASYVVERCIAAAVRCQRGGEYFGYSGGEGESDGNAGGGFVQGSGKNEGEGEGERGSEEPLEPRHLFDPVAYHAILADHRLGEAGTLRPHAKDRIAVAVRAVSDDDAEGSGSFPDESMVKGAMATTVMPRDKEMSHVDEFFAKSALPPASLGMLDTKDEGARCGLMPDGILGSSLSLPPPPQKEGVPSRDHHDGWCNGGDGDGGVVTPGEDLKGGESFAEELAPERAATGMAMAEPQDREISSVDEHSAKYALSTTSPRSGAKDKRMECVRSTPDGFLGASSRQEEVGLRQVDGGRRYGGGSDGDSDGDEDFDVVVVPLKEDSVGPSHAKRMTFVDEFLAAGSATAVASAAAGSATAVASAASGGGGSGSAAAASDQKGSSTLPIDEHEGDILRAVAERRVTIIQGETGCGKSSRVPVMLLRAPPPEPSPSAPDVRMFVSQPRRIAAKSLAERVRTCEPDLQDRIAMRMGHGVREYESRSTRCWFVTTGYLVRLLANYPKSFASHTHLIIDEVHERSVDTDILCLLCRRLLASHPTIRLILMSATMAASLYSSYFGSPEPTIFVGARRFSIREYFVEDLSQILHLSASETKDAADVYETCEKQRCHAAPSNAHMQRLFRLATQIVLSVGRHGSSVLIFVPGMSDIESITELIGKLYVPGVSYVCLPIHSDIPFEEQMTAFEPPGFGEVKVIIATNAAESSVTLPDVDHVVCLGLCKRIMYNPLSHRQILGPCWISRASAEQRAGRTGRVRKGSVYRLYSRDTYLHYMEPFEDGEMVRMPLDSVILSLRDMLKEEVTPVLLDCIEPPDMTNIERSFESLYDQKFISEPSDGGEITSLGALVVALGVDLKFGALVGLGIQFGVAAEAIEMAAILSFPKSPWLITNPLYHDSETYNDITSKTFISRCVFDAELYSEPMATMNLLWEYRHANNKGAFCHRHGVSGPRLQRLASTIKCLRNRVAGKLNIDPSHFILEEPPASMSHAKVTILRILHVWVFTDSIIEKFPNQKPLISDGWYGIKLDGDRVEEKHLLQVLNRTRHPFSLSNRYEVRHWGNFTPVGDGTLSETKFDMAGFDARFMSFVAEMHYDLAWYRTGTLFQLVVTPELWCKSEALQTTVSEVFGTKRLDERVLRSGNTSASRGRMGRACGIWSEKTSGADLTEGEQEMRLLVLSCKFAKRKVSGALNTLKASKSVTEVDSALFCEIADASSVDQSKRFSLVAVGRREGITSTAIRDLFSTPDVKLDTSHRDCPQSLRFDVCANAPITNQSSEHSKKDGLICSRRPLLEDIPEGARLLSVLSSGRRRDRFIRFSDVGSDERCSGAEFAVTEDAHVDIVLSKSETRMSQRWKRRNSPGSVFMQDNNVPAVAMSCRGPRELFACCANILEVKGGAFRVEGLTLLPPGRMFLALALLSFGRADVLPIEFGEKGPIHDDETDEDEAYIAAKSTLLWICKREANLTKAVELDEPEILSRIKLSIEFNKACSNLGEDLVCHPDKVEALCQIFDQVDGYAVEPWDGLRGDQIAIESNLADKRISVEQRGCGGKQADSELILVMDTFNTSNCNRKKLWKQGSRKYGCISCGKKRRKWTHCLQHMRECCPQQLHGRKVIPEDYLVRV